MCLRKRRCFREWKNLHKHMYAHKLLHMFTHNAFCGGGSRDFPKTHGRENTKNFLEMKCPAPTSFLLSYPLHYLYNLFFFSFCHQKFSLQKKEMSRLKWMFLFVVRVLLHFPETSEAVIHFFRRHTKFGLFNGKICMHVFSSPVDRNTLESEK